MAKGHVGDVKLQQQETNLSALVLEFPLSSVEVRERATARVLAFVREQPLPTFPDDAGARFSKEYFFGPVQALAAEKIREAASAQGLTSGYLEKYRVKADAEGPHPLQRSE